MADDSSKTQSEGGTVPRIVPPASWNMRSPYGLLKTRTGVLLVRLEDVHAWLMQEKSLPSMSATAQVFGVFASDANSKRGSDWAMNQLFLTDLSDFAEPVSEPAGLHFLRGVAKSVPHVHHPHFDKGTGAALMYALGLMAGELWAQHGIEVDLNDRLEGYSHDGTFPTVAKSRQIVGRFAVSFEVAQEIWGWGEKVETSATQAVVPRVLIKNMAPEWTGERLAKRKGELQGGRAPMQELLSEVQSSYPKMTDREIRRRIGDWNAPAKVTSSSIFDFGEVKKQKKQT